MNLTEGQAFSIKTDVTGGVSPYTYSWTKDGKALNVTTANLTGTATTSDAGSYACVVTDSKGTTATSGNCSVAVSAKQ